VLVRTCKVTESCCFNFVKIVLLSVNSVLFIVGIGVFAVGVAVLIHTRVIMSAFQQVDINPR